MKTLLILSLFILSGSFSYAQNLATEEVTLFAQCMIELQDQNDMIALESEMRQNPNIKVVRLDYYSQRAFILTKEIDQLTEEQFASWFNASSDKVRCIQIGTYGIDTVKPFPFQDCDKQ
jgi:hypothetical protein